MLPIAVTAGLLIGLSLGALGGGGSILTVPVLVYLLRQAIRILNGKFVVFGKRGTCGCTTQAPRTANRWQ
jgi:uncharacterized protein